MFGQLGFGEILMIMVVILLLFGAKRIPEVAASFGKGIKEFKKNINDATREVTDETKSPSQLDSPSRLTAADLERRRATEEAERPAPKRLL
jgi:sec-independent protein translocase protein TatA